MNKESPEKKDRSTELWSALSNKDRCAFLARLRKEIAWHQVEIIRTVAAETGKPVTEVANQEVTAALAMLRFFEKMYPHWLRPQRFRCWQPGFWTKSNQVVLEPLGKVAVIGPSNFPFSLPLLIACSSLVCGNTVVFKPSERCPGTAELLCQLVRDSGFPEGVFAVVLGGPEAAREIIAHPAVRKVIFLGSYKAGKEVAELCGRHFKPCLLELGGKNVAIVCEDADLSWAARGIAWSAFSAAGRSCVGTKIALVHKSASPGFIPRLRQEMKSIRAGELSDPATDTGFQRFAKNSRLDEFIRDATSQGARVWTQQGETTDVSSAVLEAPVLLVNVKPSMTILSPSEEVPAPVLCVREVDRIEQAVEEANASSFGLGASIWGKNLKKAKALARRLQVGLVWINDTSVGLPQFPWGGVKNSGWGRLFSRLALTELTSPKVISADKRIFSSRKFWWFPYSRAKYETFLSLNNLLGSKSHIREVFALMVSLARLRLHSRSHSKDHADKDP